MKKETGILVVLFATLLAFGAGRMSAKVSPGAQGAPVAVAEGGAAVGGDGILPATLPGHGSKDALVTIFEVSDFQGPFCGRVGPTLKKLQDDYPNDVRVVWANQPLPFHDRAKPAATAAAAAHRQGKFWEMHDKLFANQRDLTDDNFQKWAKEIGLDMAKFNADLKDDAIAKQIDRDIAIANALGARGTPAFFINGKLLSGAQPYENFKKEVDDAIAAAKPIAAQKKGVDFLLEAFTARDATVGPNVLKYYIKGESPAAEAAAAPHEAEAKDDGPAKAPPDSYDIWKVPVDAKKDAIKGSSEKALVTIVEFSDFQCPFCSRAAATVTELEKAYGDKVRIVFKHTPLPFHQNAKPAASAAIAAGLQGKFWEFYDKCFANQQALSDESFQAWAKELNLNVDKFNKDRKDEAVAKQIEDDIAAGQLVGIRGTPGFMINGRKVVGAQPANVFKAVIDEEIAKAEKAGKKGPAYYDSIIENGKVFSELGDKKDINIEGLPFKGPKDAAVTIVEFSDFQCPFCSKINAPMEAALEKDPKIKVVFAHYPLSFHQNAKPAAIMAQEAWEQSPEKFWKLHAQMFGNQKDLSEENITKWAKDAGVDVSKLTDAQKKKHEDFLNKLQEMGNKVGVEGTPTVFINGRKWEPSSGFTPEAIVDAATKAAKLK